jgi:two-component system, LytTR family, sensor histidine kinase AlgZ
MHPILQRRIRLVLYLAAWIPALALLAYVARAGGEISWPRAVALLSPACMVFAFACLSPWYIARVQPLQFSRSTSLAVTWTIASLGGGALLAGGAWLTSMLAGQPWAHFGMLALFGTVLYLLSAGLHYAVIGAEASRAAEERAAEARSLARDAELSALRMQINPHFLFNSLHSIAALATVDGARAREMCIRMSDFLRSSLGLRDRESIPLREELALARNYLEVEQVRFGERLKVRDRIESECENCAIPALLLQPLVENAVKHGVAGLIEGGDIALTVRRAGTDVIVEIENAFDSDSEPPARLGLGVAHVRRRLDVRYGERARFTAGAHDGIYRVELRFPCEPA